MRGQDWRPASLDVDSIARNAQLDRIESKLDHLLVVFSAALSDGTSCPICGQKGQDKWPQHAD